MRVAVLVRPKLIALMQTKTPKESRVLKINLAGICGTDQHVYSGNLPSRYPLVMGHEIVGTLKSDPHAIDLLSDEPLTRGDRIVVAPGIPCGRCHYCRTYGQYCDDKKFYGINIPFQNNRGEIFGGFSESMTLLPNTRVVKVPEDVTDEEAVIMEVLACAVRAVERGFLYGDLAAKKNVVVIGAGALGLSAMMMLSESGANVIAMDRIQNRLDASKKYGASKTINLGNMPLEELSETVKDMTSGAGADVAIECAGEPYAFNEALATVRKGGRIVEAGNYAYAGDAKIDLTRICKRDIEIIGSSETLYRDLITAKKIVASGKFKTGRLVTNSFSLEAVGDGITSVSLKNGIKSVVDVHG